MHPTKTVKTGWQWKTNNSLAEGTVGHMTRCSSTEQINVCYIEDIFWLHGTGKGKVHPRPGHKGPEGEKRCSSTLSLTSAPDGVGDQCHNWPLYSQERRLGGPHSQSGRVQKISPPQGFNPRTIQPVASCYTNWAVPDHINITYITFMDSSEEV